MICKYYKKRKKNNKIEKRIYYYCSSQRKEINYTECKNCLYIEPKERKPIKKRTYKQQKKEKERFSILYPDLDKCCVCGSKQSIEINEIYEGSYRQLSIKYNMVAPMCHLHHKMFHKDRLFALYYKALFQKEFEKTHNQTEFLSIFKKDYIYLYEKEKMKGG